MLEYHAIKIETHAPMSHPIRALCSDVLQHKVPQSNPPSHLLSQTQGSRSSQDSNTNSKPGVSYHISNE